MVYLSYFNSLHDSVSNSHNWLISKILYIKHIDIFYYVKKGVNKSKQFKD